MQVQKKSIVRHGSIFFTQGQKWGEVGLAELLKHQKYDVNKLRWVGAVLLVNWHGSSEVASTL